MLIADCPDNPGIGDRPDFPRPAFTPPGPFG